MGGLTTIAEFPVSDILPHIGTKDKHAVSVGGVTYMGGVASVRMQTFKKNLSCAKCGVVGNRFLLQKPVGSKNESPHFNLYYVSEKDGEYTLMTKDHVIPRSKGGPDTIANMQTMCAPCNSKKGSKADMFIVVAVYGGGWDGETEVIKGFTNGERAERFADDLTECKKKKFRITEEVKNACRYQEPVLPRRGWRFPKSFADLKDIFMSEVLLKSQADEDVKLMQAYRAYHDMINEKIEKQFVAAVSPNLLKWRKHFDADKFAIRVIEVD